MEPEIHQPEEQPENGNENKESSCLKGGLSFFATLVLISIVLIAVLGITFRISRPPAGTGVTGRNNAIVERFTTINIDAPEKDLEVLPANKEYILIQRNNNYHLVALDGSELIRWQPQYRPRYDEFSETVERFFLTNRNWVAIYDDGTFDETDVQFIGSGQNKVPIFSNDGRQGVMLGDKLYFYRLRTDVYPRADQGQSFDYQAKAAVWTADSQRLIFTTDSALFSIPAAGGQVTEALNYSESGTDQNQTVRMGQNTELLLLPGREELLLITDSPDGQREVWVLDPTSKETFLAFSAPRFERAAVSPDGSKIGYYSDSTISILNIKNVNPPDFQPLNSISGVFGEDPILWSSNSEQVVLRVNDPETGCAEVNTYRPQTGAFPRLVGTKDTRVRCYFEIATWTPETESEPEILLENIDINRKLSMMLMR